MSKCIKCDVCGRTTPDINLRYSRRKRFGWFRYDSDSHGGSEMLLDLCEGCWNGYQNYRQNRLAAKSPTQSINNPKTARE